MAELESLLLDWETGSLDETGIERLREILRNDAEARKHYVEQQMLSVALQLDENAGLGMAATVVQAIHTRSDAGSEVTRRNQQALRVSGLNSWFVALAVVLVCLLAGRLVYLEFNERIDQSGRVAQSELVTRRRDFLYGLGSSLGALALTDLLAADGVAASAAGPLSPKPAPAASKFVTVLGRQGRNSIARFRSGRCRNTLAFSPAAAIARV